MKKLIHKILCKLGHHDYCMNGGDVESDKREIASRGDIFFTKISSLKGDFLYTLSKSTDIRNISFPTCQEIKETHEMMRDKWAEATKDIKNFALTNKKDFII